MDIIKNKSKEFIFKDFNNIMRDNYHYFKNKQFWNDLDFGVVKCELCDLSIDNAAFKVKSIENISEVTNIIVDEIIKSILSYKDRKVSRVHVMFDNYSFHYYKEYEKTPINDYIDAEIEKIRKSSFKTRIKNYLLKNIVYVVHEKLEQTVALSNVSVEHKKEKDSFPITDVCILNDILNEYRFKNSTFFDESLIEKNEDLSSLLNWELRCSSGYHNHDGDFAEYTATFVGPNGTEYTFETEMSLMCNGWELREGDYKL